MSCESKRIEVDNEKLRRLVREYLDFKINCADAETLKEHILEIIGDGVERIDLGGYIVQIDKKVIETYDPRKFYEEYGLDELLRRCEINQHKVRNFTRERLEKCISRAREEKEIIIYKY